MLPTASPGRPASRLTPAVLALPALLATVLLSQAAADTPAAPSLDPVVPPDGAVGSSIDAPAPPPGDWWQPRIVDSLRSGRRTVPISLDGVLIKTLSHSPQVRVFSDLPHIRRTAVAEAAASWDWNAFVESRWDDISDPVGNELTTGGAPRFSDHNYGGSAGVRRRLTSGGSFEASQRFGWQDTNSDFFIPDQQGTSRLSISYTQPLLRGRGACYNRSLLVLAAVDTDVAEQEFSRQLQSHLVEVVWAYWGLYLERASLVQKVEAKRRAEELRDRLARRQQLDAVVAQIERADAEVALREVERLRAEMAVANAETRLRTLVGMPEWGQTDECELIPVGQPSVMHRALSIDQARATAVRRRPEVLQAISQIKAASIRANMSRHELLPTLNLLTEVYVSGLEGDGDVGRSFNAQFDEGAPSYSIGLAYEVPLGNRAAKARLTRKRLELRQLQSQYQTTLDTLALEVEAAVREVHTAAAETDARQRQVRASRTQLDYLTRRWTLLPGEGSTSSLLLENLFDAQDRLADAEFSLVSARVTHDLAVVNVKRATGELLTCEAIEQGTGCVDGLPTTFLDKQPVRGSAIEPAIQRPIPSLPAAPIVPSPATVSEASPLGSPLDQPAEPPTQSLRPGPVVMELSAPAGSTQRPGVADEAGSYFPGAEPLPGADPLAAQPGDRH